MAKNLSIGTEVAIAALVTSIEAKALAQTSLTLIEEVNPSLKNKTLDIYKSKLKSLILKLPDQQIQGISEDVIQQVRKSF